MTSFTVTTPVNITSLSGKAGSDTYTINAGSITINSDTRYSPNATVTTGPTANISVSATLGGQLNIEGYSIKLIPFDTGSGLVPAAGTIISQGGVTCELMCVMSTRTGGTVTPTASAMPLTGYLKVRYVTGSGIVAGALGGIGASATGPSETGWIVVVGVETFSFSIPKLGYMTVDGRWFSAGTTTGVRGQTIQLPHFTADVITSYPGVEIETAPGSGVYKFWANTGPKFRGDTASTDSRCRFVGIATDGILTIGMGRDSLPAGDLPVAGCDVRIPNIILQSCTVANKTVNSVPSTTMGTRYESTLSNAGRMTHSISTGAWYWNLVQPYSITISDLHTCDQIVMQEMATPSTLNRIHVGLSNYATTPVSSNSIVIQQAYNGGTIGEISGVRAEGVATSGYSVILVNMYNNWVINSIRAVYASDVTAVSGALFINTCDDLTINLAETVGKRVLVSACNRFTLLRHVHADNVRTTTLSTVGSHAIEIMSQSANIQITNIENWPGVANCHPYNGLVYMNTVKSSSVRYCGTYANPYNAGTVNLMGYILSDGGNNADIKIQRNYITGLRTGLSSGTNTTTRFRLENCYTTDASKTVGPQQNNAINRGNRWMGGSVPNSYIAVYGTSYWDAFTSDTTTRCALVLAEKTAYSSNLYDISGGNPVFSSQGALVLINAGDQVTFTWPYRVLGWTGLASFATQGYNTPNMSYQYEVDNGSGFTGVFKTLSNANLAAETGIDPVIGIILRIRITCVTTSTLNRLDSLRIDGTTTIAAQNAALYPLDIYNITINGLQSGSEVRAYVGTDPATAVLIGGAEETLTSTTFQHNSNGSSGYIQIFHLNYQPVFFYVDYIAYDKDYLVIQIPDRQYARGTSYFPT